MERIAVLFTQYVIEHMYITSSVVDIMVKEFRKN